MPLPPPVTTTSRPVMSAAPDRSTARAPARGATIGRGSAAPGDERSQGGLVELAQRTSVELSVGGPRQFVDEPHVSGTLVRREPSACELDQRLRREIRACSRNY